MAGDSITVTVEWHETHHYQRQVRISVDQAEAAGYDLSDPASVQEYLTEGLKYSFMDDVPSGACVDTEYEGIDGVTIGTA